MFIIPIKLRFTYDNKSLGRTKKQKTKTQETDSRKQTAYATYAPPYDVYIPNKNRTKPNLEKGQLCTEKGEIINRHTTGFCRPDIDWAEFGKYLKDKYATPDEADYVVYACSTGEEPYTLAILLDKIYSKTPTIQAFDISQDIIDEDIYRQQKGIRIPNPIFDYISKMIDLKNCNTFEGGNYQDVKLKKDISDSVNFSQANILTNIDTINSSKPTVIMARNMWPYVNPKEYEDFARRLYDKLAPNSIIVLGMYDYEGNPDILNSYEFPDVLLKAGFKYACCGESKYNGIGSLVFEN